MSRIMLVSLKSDDEEGSGVVACTGMRQDPLLETNIILENVTGLSWPFSGSWMNVQHWSVNRDSIQHWMVGPLQSSPSITPDLLNTGEQKVPHPPGTLPSQDLVNDKPELESFIDSFDISDEDAGVGDSPIPNGE